MLLYIGTALFLDLLLYLVSALTTLAQGWHAFECDYLRCPLAETSWLEVINSLLSWSSTKNLYEFLGATNYDQPCMSIWSLVSFEVAHNTFLNSQLYFTQLGLVCVMVSKASFQLYSNQMAVVPEAEYQELLRDLADWLAVIMRIHKSLVGKLRVWSAICRPLSHKFYTWTNF